MRSMVIAVSLLLTLAAMPAQAYYRHHGAHYRSSDGQMVHVPYGRSYHGRETALCRDGSHSVSHHHRGTCSRHGGVAHWG